MAEDAGNGGDKGGKKPKAERKKSLYTIIGAVGDKGTNIRDLSFRVIGTIQAVTPTKAKEAILAENPEFPGLDGQGPSDLQSLVGAKRLFLDAKANFNPKQVEVEQPAPRFKGL